jgi:hypothetical protein
MGIYSLFYTVLEAITHYVTEVFINEVDIMRNFDNKKYQENPSKSGNHYFKVSEKQPVNSYIPCKKHILFEFDRMNRYEISDSGELIKYSIE